MTRKFRGKGGKSFLEVSRRQVKSTHRLTKKPRGVKDFGESRRSLNLEDYRHFIIKAWIDDLENIKTLIEKRIDALKADLNMD